MDPNRIVTRCINGNHGKFIIMLFAGNRSGGKILTRQ